MKKFFFTLLIFILAGISMRSLAQSGQWVWMRGDTTINGYGVDGPPGTEDSTYNPAALYLASGWTDDQGRLWLFGGQNYDPGYYPYYIPYPQAFDRIWRYNPASNNWTYVKGTNYVNGLGVYGTMGVPDSNNHPGGRIGASIWKDHNNSIWLFGGHTAGAIEMYNDLWKYNMDDNRWTWMKGPNTYNVNGVYGTKGIESANNNPPTRREAATWVDVDNNLWMFGGYHYDLYYSQFFNDLWKYNTADNAWTWMDGSNLPDQLGNYGTMGVGDTNNIPRSRSCRCSWRVYDSLNDPRSRHGAVSWKGSNGIFWTYGGNACVDDCAESDLWKYTIDSDCITIIPTLISGVSLLKYDISPNPATDFFQLTVNEIAFANSQLNIYNLLGQKVFMMDISGKDKIRVDIENLKEGMYIVEVLSPKSRTALKLIKN